MKIDEPKAYLNPPGRVVMRSEQEAEQAIERYADTVRRICFMYLKNHHDTEDVFQEVFLKLLTREERFESETHEKSWVIRVSINACKDNLKSFFKKKQMPLDGSIEEPYRFDDEHHDVLDAIVGLPVNYRMVIYLFYYEGYSAPEISQILNKSDNTVYTWLSRARMQLKDSLGGDFLEE